MLKINNNVKTSENNHWFSLFTTHKNMYINKCEQLANEYEKLDEYLYKYHYRLKQGYKVVHFAPRTIITIFGDVTFKRRRYKYWNQKSGKFEYVCLLDKEIGLLPKQRIYFDVQFKVLSLLGDGKRYRDVLDALNHCYISKASISNILNKYDIAEYFQLAEKETKTRIDVKNKDLYIQLDETFLATLDQKVKQDQRIRLVTFHTGHKEKNYKNARRELENKRGHFLMLKVGKRINTMDYRDLLIKEVQKNYVNINYDRIIVCGDGDSWIREIANSFGNVRYILDGYHAIKKLKQTAFNIIFENRKVTLNSWIKLYKDGNHQELIKNIRNVAKNELNKDIKTNLRKASNYFSNNKQGIHHQNLEWNIGCSIESDVSHLVKQQLGYGAKIYNHKNLNNLLHLRMANLNNLNVLHYINENINSEIEIRKEIYKNSLWNKYNNKNDDSWINYKGNAVTNKYNRFK
ncbi:MULTISPECIES: Mbov_0401 family ICE element transposase-like protein [unclassified Spiroplasma]|uniref:Mbov_0401 family ICE element transposase-like protein n=2 Tax=unclassified Spiroplasma TaxID=2637901 RepID=UPI00313C3416